MTPDSATMHRGGEFRDRARWYLHRLNLMSAPELVHRGRQALTMALLHLHYRRFGGRHPMSGIRTPAFCNGRTQLLPPLEIDENNLRDAAPALLDGYTRRPGSNWRWMVDDDDIWHRAPDTGRLWPAGFFGSVPYRPGNPYGDIRELWEPSRLQHLVDLALLAARSPADIRRRALRLLSAQLTSWVVRNPPLTGPHYVSSMECALRLIAACYALDLARPWLADSDPARGAVAALIACHAPLIMRRLSLYSSLGNHTIAEAAGLLHAGVLFPEMQGAPEWRRQGLALLAREADHQILEDGGGAEQAVGYHRVNLQLLALCERLLIRHRLPTEQRLHAALLRGTRFLHGISVRPGDYPDIGDGDGGEALTPSLMDGGEKRAPLRPAYGVTTFPQSGYTVVRTRGGTHRMQLLIDHGPLGMAPAFGHGHADALALLLWVNTTPLLVDTGTYAYHGDPAWRRYFKSTTAHNTVTVDETDQATQQGSFIWTEPFAAERLACVSACDGCGMLLARHNGYASRGVQHTRGVAWSDEGWLLVQDMLSGGGIHELALHWHLAVPADRQGDGSLALRLAGGTATMTCTGGYVSLHRAETKPALGWHSPAYGIRRPITTVRVYHHGELSHRMITLLTLPDVHVSGRRIEECLQWMTRTML